MFAVRTVAAVRVSFVALFALIATSFVATPARASFVAATTVSSSNGETVSFTFNGTAVTAFAGTFQTTLFNPNGTPASATLNTYCVDVTQELKFQQDVNVGSISTLAGGFGNYVGSLYANFAAGATTAVDKAALQLAIWKTEYDGPNATSNTGHFVLTSAPSDVANQAAYYYTHNTLVANTVSYLQVVAGETGQSLVGPSFTPAAVPEPASVAMLGMGLVAVVGTTARRRLRRSIAG